MAETNLETPEVSCSHCSAPLHSEADYCGYCGATVRAEQPPAENSLACAKCQKPLLEGATFCGYCGAAAVVAEAPLDYELLYEPPKAHEEPKGQAPRTSRSASPLTKAKAPSFGTFSPRPPISVGKIVAGLAAAVVLAGLVFAAIFIAPKKHKSDVPGGSPSASTGDEASISAQPPAVLPAKILTKDPEFIGLLNPPQPTLMQACLERHRTDWFEIGHVEASGAGALRLTAVSASPLELSGDASISVDAATLEAAYAKFRELTKMQAETVARVWMDQQTCRGKLKNVCENLGGTPEQCSDPAALSEIYDRLGSGLSLQCNDNPSLEEGMDIAEKKMQSERLVLVGQGDLTANRIDKLMLVDYDTETILATLPPDALPTNQLTWKFAAAANAGQNMAQAGKQSPANTPVADTAGVSVEAPQPAVKEAHRKRAILSTASSPQTTDSIGTAAHITPAVVTSTSLAGSWHGDYTNADSNQVTKVSLKIVEEEGRADALTGSLVFDAQGTNSASCSVAGVYNAQNKFMLLSISNCQGHPPGYLQGKIGFSSISPSDRQTFGVDSLHNSWLNISR